MTGREVAGRRLAGGRVPSLLGRGVRPLVREVRPLGRKVRHPRLLSILPLPFLLLAACAPTLREPPGEVGAIQASVPIRVENDHAAAVLISAESRSVRLRLGVVGPGERSSLVLPGGQLPAGAVRFRIRGEGTMTSYLSPPLMVSDDSQLHVQVAPNLDRSRVWVE